MNNNNNKRLAKRKCEMWISNNKVLIGGLKKPHARNPNFETEETKLLISLWGDPKVQKTLITTHKKHPVIMKLAEKMREHGYFRSAEEINTRIKNLKCFYNRIKKDVEIGIITEPTWKHYAAMEEIITRPIFGNHVQQPHLQHLLQKPQQQLQKLPVSMGNTYQIKIVDSQKCGGGDNGAAAVVIDEDDSNELRPEDLLSVVDDDEADDDEEDDDDFDEDDDNNGYDAGNNEGMEFEETTLIPKEEPIDIDEMDDSQQREMEKLSQYLQLAAASPVKTSAITVNTSILDIKQSPQSSPASVHSSENHIKIVSATSQPIVANNNNLSSTIKTSMASKISLVPTNILMKQPTHSLTPSVSTATLTPMTNGEQATTATIQLPKQQALSFNQQIFCAKSASGTQTVYTTTNGGMPMKVLLVNALQKPTPTAVAPSCIASTPHKQLLLPKQTTVTTMPNNTPIHATRSTTFKSSTKPLFDSRAETSSAGGAVGGQKTEIFSKAGIRSLLQRMVTIQNETLTVQKQRLELDKRRLNFEQNVGDKLLTILQTLTTHLQTAAEDKK